MMRRPLLPAMAMAVLTMAVGASASAATAPASPEGPTMTRIARGTFTVQLAPLAFEGQAEGSKLGRMSIDKQIAGDLVATTRGQMLSATTGESGSAAYVAIERVEGRLHERAGSFVLQHTGTMTRGTPSLSVHVVPDSGTGELVGLRGRFDIVIADGEHRYVFEYSLP